MAFNVGTTSKETFTRLKNLSIQKRMDAVRGPEAATILSMLTPMQFAELFPKYYQQGLPDVGGFREAISRRSRQKQDDINFGLSQGAKSLEEAEQMGTWRRRFGGDKDQETITSSFGNGNKSITNPVMARDIYNYLKSKGVDHVHAMGILASIQGESKFNAGAQPPAETMRREGGPSGGLFQHHDNASKGEYRFTNMVKAAGGEGVWQRNWKGQIDFALSEPDMKKYLSRSFSNERDAVRGFVYDFERPRDKEGDTANRQGYLKSLSAAVTSGGPASPGSAPDFSQYVLHKGVNNYQGQCGIGTRQLAGRMFGSSYFEKGLGEGGDFHAGSLSAGNKYFQTSGLYASGKPMSKDGLTQEYLNSLPIGTVVSSQGGSRGGHVQIKIGPNQWASDTVQSGFFEGNSYSNFVIHEPNEAGLAILAKNGVMQPGEMPGVGPKIAQEGQPTEIAAQQTVAPVAPAPRQPDIPPEVPDSGSDQAPKSGQSATVSKPDKATQSAAKTFNVNREALIGAIKQTDEFKNTFGSSLASDEMIYDGFFGHEKTKKLMADTQSSFDPNTGTVKIGNYEAFKKSIGMDTSKILTEVPSTVPSHAGGGREKVKGPLHMRHLHKERRGDTALVTDARGKQFTVNPKKETMTVNPQTGVMDIKPVKSSDQMEIEKLMAIIRKQESGSFEGKYDSDLAKKAKPGKRHNTASGAYQFNNKTWQGVLNKELNMPGILKQYPRAVNAPKEVQDQVMRARIEKWRAAGHTDNEIILHHFTGNKEGKLTASAQRGNPTPAQYRAQIASHATEYDKVYSKPEAKTDVASSGPITTQPAPQKTESIAAKLAAPIKSLMGSPSVEAAQVKPAPESPPKGEVSVGPAGMDENWFKQQEAASPQTRTQLPPDRPESPIVMNPAETRPAHMQPTPSLARAMDNARGVTDSGYSNLTGTKLGGK